jgi:PadR family transcriptional regulator PadR
MAKADHLQGALELLILKILKRGPNHGFAIATLIEQTSNDVLRVEEGSLYPALHRMTESGLLKAEWRMTEAGRRARVYQLTTNGRRRLADSEARWHDVTAAVAKVLRTV